MKPGLQKGRASRTTGLPRDGHLAQPNFFLQALTGLVQDGPRMRFMGVVPGTYGKTRVRSTMLHGRGCGGRSPFQEDMVRRLRVPLCVHGDALFWDESSMDIW